MGSLFKGPKMDPSVKEANEKRLASERARARENKDEALASRIAGTNYGIRSLLGGGSRGGFA